MPRKRPPIDPDIEKFIRLNIEEKTITDIARDLDLHKSVVLSMVNYLKITERFKSSIKRRKKQYRVHPLVESEAPIIRPPAVYDNKSREDHVEHWLL